MVVVSEINLPGYPNNNVSEFEVYQKQAFEWNIWLNEGKELNRVGMQEYTINAHFTINVDCGKKALKKKFVKS